MKYTHLTTYNRPARILGHLIQDSEPEIVVAAVLHKDGYEHPCYYTHDLHEHGFDGGPHLIKRPFSDLAIDTLVYVRDSEEKAWVPRYYAGFDYETNQVKVWINGTTSITTNGMTTCWKHCKLEDDK